MTWIIFFFFAGLETLAPLLSGLESTEASTEQTGGLLNGNRSSREAVLSGTADIAEEHPIDPSVNTEFGSSDEDLAQNVSAISCRNH